jgi:hypothetical protein
MLGNLGLITAAEVVEAIGVSILTLAAKLMRFYLDLLGIFCPWNFLSLCASVHSAAIFQFTSFFFLSFSLSLSLSLSRLQVADIFATRKW